VEKPSGLIGVARARNESMAAATPINPDGFSTGPCSCIGNYPKGYEKDPALWEDGQVPGFCFLACPCEPFIETADILGMFEDGSMPMSKNCCRIWTYIWCPIAVAAGPQAPCLHYYVVKTRYKIAEKAGFQPESCGKAWCNTIALGLSVAQVSREMVIRGLHPNAKKVDGGTAEVAAVPASIERS